VASRGRQFEKSHSSYRIDFVECFPALLRRRDVGDGLNGPFEPRGPDPQALDILLLNKVGQRLGVLPAPRRQVRVAADPTLQVFFALAVLKSMQIH